MDIWNPKNQKKIKGRKKNLKMRVGGILRFIINDNGQIQSSSFMNIYMSANILLLPYEWLEGNGPDLMDLYNTALTIDQVYNRNGRKD